jgi:acetolactate synthase-1/2/3 large subunit
LNELNNAKKPVFLIGGGVNIAHARKEMQELAELTGVPVVTTIMGKGAIPTDHPLYVGNIGMHGNLASNKAIQECDVLFSIGTRFNDRITGTIDTFARNARIIHIDIDAASISRNIKVDIPIVADAKVAISKMLKYAKKLEIEDWVKEIMEVKAEYPINMNSYSGVTPEKIIKTINDMYDDLIITTDVGQNQLWTTQYINITGDKQLLTSGGLGTMGYGLPAAIGAKIGNPDKNVICISGDGGVQMNIQEMATAVAEELPITLCILNNGYLGNVRQWQELFFNKRYSSTCLRYRKRCNRDCQNPDKCCPKYTPDFVKLAESYEALGIRVTKEEDIRPAFEAAKANKSGPTVIEFYIDPAANVFPMVPGGKSLDEMILDC